ncbi:MAG: pilus assembly protein PilM [Myxococcota bacterium]|nr:pilus assembly protein PilM [Myxococcota bacterium]
MNNVLGLDVGTHAIKAVELKQTFRGLEPIQMRVHPRGLPEASLPDLLRRFINMHQLPTDHIVAALPGESLSVRRMEFPFRDQKRLAAAVPFEVEGETPFELEDVLVDWEIVGGDRSRAELAVSIAPRRAVSETLDSLHEAGCKPRVLESDGLALANLHTAFGWEGTRLVLDVGHETTSYCVVRDGSPLTARTIRVGGRHITEALAKQQNWSLEEAEHAKCEDGIFHVGFESASPAAVAVLDRIAREAARTLDGVESLLGGPTTKQVGGVVLVGGSARLHRFDEYLSERIGIQASRPEVPPEGEGAALLAAGDPAMFASALALALRGTARATTRGDFRQEEFAYRTNFKSLLGRDLRPTAILAGAVATLGLATAATSVTLESQRADTIVAEIARLYEEAAGKPPVGNAVQALGDDLYSARDRADFLGVYGGNLSALDLLSELSGRIPADLDIRVLEINITGRVIRLKVAAKDFEAAERLTSVLSSEAPFEAAEVKGGIESTKDGTRFTVTISLSSSAEGDVS